MHVVGVYIVLCNFEKKSIAIKENKLVQNKKERKKKNKLN